MFNESLAARARSERARPRRVRLAHDRHGQAQGNQRYLRPRGRKQRHHAGGAVPATKHPQRPIMPRASAATSSRCCCPGASPEVAEAVVKRVRHNVYKTTLDLRSRMIRCSVSIGVVNYPKDGARHARALRASADARCTATRSCAGHCPALRPERLKTFGQTAECAGLSQKMMAKLALHHAAA